MAAIKIEEVYLYVSEHSESPAENIQAMAFMDHQTTVPFTRMLYNDPAQFEDIFKSINSWLNITGQPEVTKFPFITYVEVHDDIPARHSPVKALEGIDAIKTIVDIYSAVNP